MREKQTGQAGQGQITKGSQQHSKGLDVLSLAKTLCLYRLSFLLHHLF